MQRSEGISVLFGFFCFEKATLNPFQFLQEVRQETSKVSWPTWNEVWITTVMVLIMVSMAALFFMAIDQILGAIVNFVLRVGR